MQAKMSNELQRAKELLDNNPFTCVLVGKDTVYSSAQRGVKPLLRWLDEGLCLKQFSAADKVVGKAAAYLYVLLGIRSLYAKVISEQALGVLEDHKIEVSYDTKVEVIRNRTNTGLCPMEQCVIGINTPREALGAIRKKLFELTQMNSPN